MSERGGGPEGEHEAGRDSERGMAPSPAVTSARQTREPDEVCWCCGGATLKRHCKIVCLNCGFTRDCSDP